MPADREMLRVAAVVGSLRHASYTRRLVQGLGPITPAALSIDIVPIGDLPLYNEDQETSTPPAAWKTFRDRISPADAILFATPEYNRSVPGCLKNAIDVGSRPIGASVWAGKPAAVLSVSPGALGAFGANHHLRQSLVFLDMPVLQQPEAYIVSVAQLLGEDSAIKSPHTREFLRQFLEQFEQWIRRHPLHHVRS
jgi:chromate reductase